LCNKRLTVVESGALCEAAICYTGDLFDPNRSKYNLQYYVRMAKQLERAGAHVIAIKDMAGVCRPRAASALVKAIRQEVGLPLHFHTHDTSGASAATVLAAIEAGCDAVDAALDSMSGLTSQPSMGALVAALEGTSRAPELAFDALNEASHYWEGVRRYYSGFEAEMRSGTSDVYRHEMPGGQYTNLREQARAMGLEHRWSAVAKAYAEVNRLFGDIIKVTPTSKVVGDMALFMVANDLTADDVLDPWREIAFPESVVSLFKGELGFPADGFPVALSRKVLKQEPPAPYRPGERLAALNIEAAHTQAEKEVGHKLNEAQLSSYLMYPKVYREFADHQRLYGDVSVIPTPTFFYGLQAREEVAIDIDPGKTLLVRLQGVAPSEEEDEVKVFFELNGQPRTVRVAKHLVKTSGAHAKTQRARAEDGNPAHLPAPMPGMVVTVAVKPGQAVKAGDPLVSIEAMKMETQLRAERDGIVKAVYVKSGDTVAARDLLLEMQS
jgi:pyruvate carboxylase